MKPVSHLVGQRFGKLTVTEDLGTKKGGKIHMWRCVCDCGGQIDVAQDHLIQGLTKSCGCLHDSIGKENLRLVNGTSVTKLEKRRGKVYRSNTSGCSGVYQQNSHGKKTGRWNAQIGFCGKTYFLGTFDRLDDAVAARKEAEEQLYDGFLDWYYKEYLPEQKAGVSVGRQRIAAHEPYRADRDHIRAGTE